MSYNEIGKAMNEIVKDAIKKVNDIPKEIDNRFDIKNILNENLNTLKKNSKIDDIDERFDIKKVLKEDLKLDKKNNKTNDTDSRFDIKNILRGDSSEETKEKNNKKGKEQKSVDKIDTNNDIKLLEAIIIDEDVYNEFLEENPDIKNKFDRLNNNRISDAERQKLEREIATLKGKYFEFCIKKFYEKKGITTLPNKKLLVENQGGTITDYMGKNNTNKTIEIFGEKIKPGETISTEAKCGNKKYLNEQLNNGHIDKQLKTDANHKFLVTTNDINDVDKSKATNICDSNGAKLVSVDLSAADIDKIFKGV